MTEICRIFIYACVCMYVCMNVCMSTSMCHVCMKLPGMEYNGKNNTIHPTVHIHPNEKNTKILVCIHHNDWWCGSYLPPIPCEDKGCSGVCSGMTWSLFSLICVVELRADCRPNPEDDPWEEIDFNDTCEEICEPIREDVKPTMPNEGWKGRERG